MSRNYKTKQVQPLAAYDEVYSVDESNTVLRSLARRHANKIVDHDERESLLGSLDRCDYRSLCDGGVDYAKLSPHDAAESRQVRAFFQKRNDLELGVDRRAVAVAKFLDAERACCYTNSLLRIRRRGGFQFPSRVEGVLHTASRKIADILGDAPTLAGLKMRFGPGATTTRKKKDAHPRYKLGDAFACSESLLPLAGELLAEMPGWVGLTEDTTSVTVPVEIHTGRVEFVPKNWKTLRGIVVEPLLNTMFQLAVGDYIAQRLRLVGVNVRDQTRNQRMAHYGSLTGALATLDLSSASDTISRELVAELLPLDWYILLSYGRTPVVELEGEFIRQEKFSSMGNGFTFPLETLIFYALAFACCEGQERDDVMAYGDDLIVPSHRFTLLSEVLTACGFTVNGDKSFYHGAFRESCGKDYLLGYDIRPKYITDRVSAASLFELHNFYVRKGDEEMAAATRRFLAPSVQIFGPDGYGDGHLLGKYVAKPLHPERGWEGHTFDTFKLGKRQTAAISKGDYLFPAYSIYSRNHHCDEPGDSQKLEWRFADYLRDVEYSVPDKEGRTRVTLPGSRGYKRISIYTLAGA